MVLPIDENCYDFYGDNDYEEYEEEEEREPPPHWTPPRQR